MTGGASDPPGWQPHIRNKARREMLAKRFRDPGDPLRVVLVRDMWLTGFDALSLHTMYVDKPMRGHGLMQAIARVNRVFGDKPGGLVVDYLGLAHELKQALATYTESGGTGKTTVDQSEAVAVMLEKYEVCRDLFHGFDYSGWIDGTSAERVSLLPGAQEHILAQENGKERCLRAVRELSQAFALAVPHEEAIRIRDDVAFFQAVRSVLAKRAGGEARAEEELDYAIRQIVSRAGASEGVVDIFAAAGLEKPDISILSEEFLAEVRGMKQRNLAVELLRKLLKGELAVRRRKNVVQARSFAEMLEQTIHRYGNRAVEAAQVIEELIQLARDMREANARGEALGLTEDELAFYDALETNDSAMHVLGDETLRDIARELVETVRNNVKIDWTLRENVRANLRRLVKRILRKHGYPPDKRDKATRTVLERGFTVATQFYAFPEPHWARLRTTNSLERLHTDDQASNPERRRLPRPSQCTPPHHRGCSEDYCGLERAPLPGPLTPRAQGGRQGSLTEASRSFLSLLHTTRDLTLEARSFGGSATRHHGPSDRLQVDELRKVVRTIGLDRIPESEFISVVATPGILDCEHLNGGVEAPRVAQYDDLAEGWFPRARRVVQRRGTLYLRDRPASAGQPDAVDGRGIVVNMNPSVTRTRPLGFEFQHSKADDVAPVVAAVVEYDFAGRRCHSWRRYLGRFAGEGLDAQFVGDHCRELRGRVLPGAFVDDVRRQTGHPRVIEANGKDVLVLLLDHAAKGRPPFMIGPSL